MFNKYNEGEITSTQFYILIVSFIIGTGILTLATSVCQVAKQDGWISVLITGIFVSLFTYISIFVASRFKNLSFLQYSSYLLSKPIGFLISFSYFIYAILMSAALLRSLSEMVVTWFLPRTPIYITILITLITVVNIAKDGMTFVARFCQAIFLLIIPLVLLLFIPITEISFINIMPIGGAGISKILEGTIPSFFSYAGYEMTLFLYPFIANKNKNIAKTSSLCILSITLLYTFLIITQTALFGPEELQTLMYPTITYLDVKDVLIIERIEIVFSILWIFKVLTTIIIQFYLATLQLQALLNTKTNSIFAYILTPVVFILTLYPRNVMELNLFKEKLSYYNIFIGLVLPLVLLIMIYIKGEGINKNGKKI
ncbi:GerAB/ArcD/ProY family transporter [Anaerobranca gottschalkii]|uniref:Spore germination protein n=1 Tax=Anaerobranca gottschalkii DSM 13577 TaxID=1120990 RepID=A0A1H9YGI9_9FIRM|nr:endospore germination permease [Anaerobranca gottschalkii]SES68079.1 Spore germination protein [Anaerobranca gottschalkii DSM 13577]